MTRRPPLLTNAAMVLFHIAHAPRARIEDMANDVGVSGRTVQRLLDELEGTGMLSRTREGNHYVYTVHLERPIADPPASTTVGDLLGLLGR
jgi:DNA-binding IclR family transcriptional regulator